MPRYVSGRAKRTPQTGITSDRYEFLGLEQAEPNLGDPKVGPSSVGANPIKAGLAYQLLAIDNYPGERYWSTLAGIGSTVGTISVYNENVLITENFAAIHGLDFVGTGVTVIRPTIEGPFPGVGIATIQIEINDLPNQGEVNQIIYNSNTGYAIGASDFYYVNGKIGIGTTNPSQKLTVFGNGIFTGDVTANNFYGNFSGNADTATNVIGGIGSLTSLTVSGITTLGFVTAQNAYVSGIITAGYFDGIVLQEVSKAETSKNVIGGIASVTQLNVNGISTLGFITASNAYFTGIVTASQFIGTASFATTAGRLQTARTINVVGPDFNSTGKLFDGTTDIAIDLSLKPIVGLNSGIYGSATFIPVLGINSVGIITSATTVEITSVENANYSKIAGYSTVAGFSTVSGISTLAQGLTGVPNIIVGIVTANEYYGTFKGIISPTVAISSANYANISGIATNVIGGIASVSQLQVTGISTLGFITANNAYFTGIVTATEYYGLFKGTIDSTVTLSNAEYAKRAGVATNVIGGIASVSQLQVTGISTLGFITANNAYFTGIVTASQFIGTASFATTAGYANNSGYATIAGYSTIAGFSTISGISTLAQGLTGTPNIQVGIVTATEYYGLFKGTIDTGVTLANAEYAKIAGYSTNSGIASYATIAGYSTNSGIATYATIAGYSTNSGIATYATIAGYSTNSGIATYAVRSGISTNVIGGIASVTQLNVTGISTLGFITSTNAFFTGIVTASEYYGVFKGTIDTGVTLANAEYAKIAGYSTNSGIATYATVAGYSTNSGIATYAAVAGYSTNSGIATYAIRSGISTNVIGGIASVTQLNVTGISTLGFITSTNAFFTGIVTASEYYGVFKGTIDTGVTLANAEYAKIAGYSTNSGIASYATVAGYSTNSGIATYAVRSGISTNVIGGIASVTQLNVTGISTLGIVTATSAVFTGIVTASEYYGVFKGTIDTGVTLANAEYAKIAGYSTNSGIATYATIAGYSTNSGIASYATVAGYSTNSGIATYAVRSGISTNVIGGIASVTQLNVTGISTLGIVTATSAVFTGIVTASEYYGVFKGTIDTGVTLANAEYAKIAGYSTISGIATNVIGGISSVSRLQVNGISTLGSVEINSGVITAKTGVVTYYGDGSKLTGVIAEGISFNNDQWGVNSSGIFTTGFVGIGTTVIGEALQVGGNLRVGLSTVENYIAFHGTYGDGSLVPGSNQTGATPSNYNHTYIGERIYEGTENSELLIFKGNDPVLNSYDRIRLFASEHYFDTYSNFVSGSFASVGSTTDRTTRFVIKNSGNIGINTTSPLAQLHVMNSDMTKDSLILIETDTFNLDTTDANYQTRGVIGFTENRSASTEPHVMFAALYYGDGPEITSPSIGQNSNTNKLVLASARRSNTDSTIGGIWFAVQDPSTLASQTVGQTGSIELYNKAGFSTVTIQAGLSAWGNFGIGTTGPTSKLEVVGDARIGINTSQGVILTSPNGTKYRLIVDDSGNLSTVVV